MSLWKIHRGMMMAVLFSFGVLGYARAHENTLFLHHFDAPVLEPPDIPLQYPGAADCAAGSAAVVSQGGRIDNTVAKWGPASMDHANYGGQLRYNTAGNFNLAEGTVEMWIRPTVWENFEFNGFFSITQSSGNDIRFQKTPDQRIEAYMFHQGGSGIWFVESPNDVVIDDNTWHHLAWTWDFAGQQSHIYLDGQVISNNLSGTLAYTGTVKSTFEIGTIQNGSGSFDGFIDDFRISDIDRYHGEAFTVPTGPFECAPSLLAGDYNDDGNVNAADYAVWRKREGTATALPNDPIGGTIGQPQYDQWKSNFGESGSGSSPAAAVPEPGSILVSISSLVGLALASRKRAVRSPRLNRLTGTTM